MAASLAGLLVGELVLLSGGSVTLLESGDMVGATVLFDSAGGDNVGTSVVELLASGGIVEFTSVRLVRRVGACVAFPGDRVGASVVAFPSVALTAGDIVGTSVEFTSTKVGASVALRSVMLMGDSVGTSVEFTSRVGASVAFPAVVLLGDSVGASVMFTAGDKVGAVVALSFPSVALPPGDSVGISVRLSATNDGAKVGAFVVFPPPKMLPGDRVGTCVVALLTTSTVVGDSVAVALLLTLSSDSGNKIGVGATVAFPFSLSFMGGIVGVGSPVTIVVVLPCVAFKSSRDMDGASVALRSDRGMDGASVALGDDSPSTLLVLLFKSSTADGDMEGASVTLLLLLLTGD